jgi:hypothetical protein
MQDLEALTPAYFKFYTPSISNQADNNAQTPFSAQSNDSNIFFSINKNGLFGSDNENTSENYEAAIFSIEEELKVEIIKYAEIISNKQILQSINSSTKFWNNQTNLPKLRQLFIILNNVSASSAFIERFFSYCGLVCNQRSMNMKNDLIINRSFLKVNIEILNELNKTYE